MEIVRVPVEHWDFPRGTASSLLLVSYAEAHGVPADEVLSGTDLSPGMLRDPHRQLSAGQELRIAENLVRALGDPPGLGWDVGAGYRIATFGIFGYACVTSPTVRDAIRFALRYYELSFGFCLPSVRIADDVVELALQSPGVSPELDRFLLQRDLASMNVWLTDLVGEGVAFDSVDFAFDGPDGYDYAAIVGREPRFGQPLTRSTFSAEILDQPLPQANEITVASAEEACRTLLAERRRRTGWAGRVRDSLVTTSGSPPSLDEVARRLATSERSLRRRLTEEGTSYRSLLAEVRQTLAEQMLATGALSVEDVAIRLGYAEASSFIAAFKGWTGTTPARWQRRS